MKEAEGCNLIVLDCLICGIAVGFSFHKYLNISLSLSIVLGIVAGIILCVLMALPVVGFILQCILGIVWGLLIYAIISSFIELTGMSNIIIAIISVIFGVLLHFASYYQLNGELEIPDIGKRNSKAYKGNVQVNNLQTIENSRLGYQQFIKEYSKYYETKNTLKLYVQKEIETYRDYDLINELKSYLNTCNKYEVEIDKYINVCNKEIQCFYPLKHNLDKYLNLLYEETVKFNEIINNYLIKKDERNRIYSIISDLKNNYNLFCEEEKTFYKLVDELYEKYQDKNIDVIRKEYYNDTLIDKFSFLNTVQFIDNSNNYNDKVKTAEDAYQTLNKLYYKFAEFKGKIKAYLLMIANISNPESNIGFETLFSGCDSLRSLTKRRNELIKIYHPDNGNSDDRMIKIINDEYERLKGKYN